MQKILKIAQREYIETAKTKTFILSILMVPFIIGAIIFFTGRTTPGPRLPINLAVIDLSNELFAEAKNSFDNYNKTNPNRKILIEKLAVGQDPNESQKEAFRKKVKGWMKC